MFFVRLVIGVLFIISFDKYAECGKIRLEYQVPSLNLNTIHLSFVERNADIEEDATLPVPDLVRKHGYPCEEHSVKTPDGYILTLHRIPYGNRSYENQKRPIAFLQHGILASSADWVITGTEKGLAFLLAEEGYDVWMGNVRGNRYSRNHVYLLPGDDEFWDFSWHEMGVQDLPTMIDYALELTEQKKLTYIGHSQGNTIFYVMCSELPRYNYKIEAQFSLAPIAYISNMKSPLLKILAHFRLVEFASLVGVNEFLPQSAFMAKLGATFCGKDQVTQVLCTNSLFAICGFNSRQLNATLLPVILGHTPAGASVKQFQHFAQEIRSGKFRKWDYGLLNNYKHYGSFSPPNYNLKNVKVPVHLFYAENDWLASKEDVMKLYKELGNPNAAILIPDLKFNHVDFIFAIDSKKLLYDNVIALMKKYRK